MDRATGRDTYLYDDPSLKLPPERLKVIAENSLKLKVTEVGCGYKVEEVGAKR